MKQIAQREGEFLLPTQEMLPLRGPVEAPLVTLSLLKALNIFHQESFLGLMHKVIKITTLCFDVEPRHITGMPRSTVEVRKGVCKSVDSPPSGGGAPASRSPGGILRLPGQKVSAAQSPPTPAHLQCLLTFPGNFIPVEDEKDQRETLPERPTNPAPLMGLPATSPHVDQDPAIKPHTNSHTVTWWDLDVTGSIWALI